MRLSIYTYLVTPRNYDEWCARQNIYEHLKALPHVLIVSINGPDIGNTSVIDWDQLLQSLGERSFDTFEVVKLMMLEGYTSQIGLKSYNINLYRKLALLKSMMTWNGYRLKLD